MLRDVTERFHEWKNSENLKPLLITGVRQCGKTHAMKDYGEKYFEDYAYFNFEMNQSLKEIFAGDLDPYEIIKKLNLISEKPIIPGKSLLIFDEIQACPEAITSLKYFNEVMSNLHIMAAGSLLGVILEQESISFPVGRVERIRMYPMSFSEFLRACNEPFFNLIDTSTEKGVQIADSYADILEDFLNLYYIIGGMPEAVKTWLETNDLKKVDEILDTIIKDYESDFSKHAPNSDRPKLSWIWDSIPEQLSKENNKFKYSAAKSGKREKDLGDALKWLELAGLINKLTLTKKIELPLSAFEDKKYFKIYMCDVGLLRKKAGLSGATIMNNNIEYATYKGAFVENFVMNELLCQGKHPYFWKSENTAEIDFLIDEEGKIIPIEVKATVNTKAKSFRNFCQKYTPEIGFRFSLKNVHENYIEKTKSYTMPLYLIWKMNDYIDKEKVLKIDDLDQRISEVLKTHSKNKTETLKSDDLEISKSKSENFRDL